MDHYKYGLTFALELLLLVGQYYFSSVINFTLMKLISLVCIMHTCQTDIRSESFKETFTFFYIQDKFSNRKDISSIKRVNICYRYFADNLQKKVSKEQSFYMNINPYIPTIISVTRENENLPPNAIFETIETLKKPPRQKIFQEDQMKPFKKIGCN